MTMTTLKTSLLASLACMLLAFAGCSPAADSPEQETAQTQQALGCNCFGTFTCTSNGFEADYAPYGCGAALQPHAKTYCKSRCGGVACVDTGWICAGK